MLGKEQQQLELGRLCDVDKYLKPGAMGCIWVLLGGKGSFNSRWHKGDSCVSMDTFVSEVSPMEQPTPGDEFQQGNETRTTIN